MFSDLFSESAHRTATPLVTVAVPFFRPGSHFQLALRSILSQTFHDWELLLVDDGGRDGSLELARELRDPRVHVISDGHNLGLAVRLNQLARLARGRYLFRMDADDIMHPRRIEQQLELLECCGENTVVGTAAFSIDEQSRVVGLRPAKVIQGTGYAMRHSFLHPTVAATTAWFRNHPYSERYVFRRSEDAELWCRTSADSEFRWIDRPLLFYREMGVFKLEHYAAAAEGLNELINEFEPHSAKRENLRRRVQAKLALARMLDHFNACDLLVRRRFDAIRQKQLIEAREALRVAVSSELPSFCLPLNAGCRSFNQ